VRALSAEIVLFLSLLSTPLASQHTPRPIEGHVIEARANSAETLYLWDATPYVIHLVHDHLVGTSGMRALEQTAIVALCNRAKAVRSHNVTMRALYQRVGAVDPAYGTPTFAGVERVFTLRASREDASTRAAKWLSAVNGGTVPSGLHIEITGKLPPPHLLGSVI